MKDPELVARSMREAALESKEIAREPVPEPLVVIRQVYTPSEEQKKLYFNAGRWAGGSRDWVARKAYEELMNGNLL